MRVKMSALYGFCPRLDLLFEMFENRMEISRFFLGNTSSVKVEG